MKRINNFIFFNIFLSAVIFLINGHDVFAQSPREFLREYNIYKSFDSALKPKRSVVEQSRSEERKNDVFLKNSRILGGSDPVYSITPGDLLNISYVDRGEVRKDAYQVSSDGYIPFPLIGDIYVEQLTRYELIDMLNQKLGVYIRSPQVNVGINESGTVMIDGAVSAPGVYKYGSKMTVMEALYKARYSKAAKLNNIFIMRGTVDKPIIKAVDLKKMLKYGDRTDNVYLKPGDLVYVPKTTYASVNEFINKVYGKIIVWYGLGGQDIIDPGKPFLGPVGTPLDNADAGSGGAS